MAQEIIRRTRLDGTVEQSTITIPDKPVSPTTMDRDQFDGWFVATFGADAKTAAQIKAAWPQG